MKIYGWLVRRYQLETMFQGEVRVLQIDDNKIKPLRDALSICNGRRTDGFRYQTRKTPEGLQVVLVSSELLTDSEDWQIDTTRDCTADVMKTTLRALNASAKRRGCRYRFRAAGPNAIIKRKIWQRKVWVRPESFHKTLKAIRSALHGKTAVSFPVDQLPEIRRVRDYLRKSGTSIAVRKFEQIIWVASIRKKSEKIV